MAEIKAIKHTIKNQLELNLSYMPFIRGGGLFIPTTDAFSLDEKIILELQLPSDTSAHRVECKVIWITPKNALYQIYPGIGVEFAGENIKYLLDHIKSSLDDTSEIGGYTYGIMSEQPKSPSPLSKSKSK